MELTKDEVRIIRRSQRMLWRWKKSKVRRAMFNCKNEIRWNKFIRERLYENIKHK